MKKALMRVVILTLAALILILPVTSCASKGKTLLTLNKDGIKVTFSVNLYELMISRMKGMLVSAGISNNGVTADREAFWDYQDKFNGKDLQTLNQYYDDLILDNCRTYTAALWLFEKEGLTLTDTQLKSVEDRLNDLLEDHGDGSKTKLNAILSNYGVNFNILREVYLMEEKVNTLQTKLYGNNASLIGTVVKDEFLAEQYVHFKQIFFPAYRYIYETDQNGDTIYFVAESQKLTVCYDTVHGYEAKDANGIPVTDKNGDQVYYTTPDGPRIAYDMTNGMPSCALNSDGTAKTADLTADELKTLKERVNTVYDSLQGCTVEEFETAMEAQNSELPGGDPYTDGYYLRKSIDYEGMGSEYSYFKDIITALDSMENGGIAKITSDSAGYHIIMKYPHTSGAYTMEINEPWFKDFTSSLVEQIFLEECRSYYDEITVDFKVLASATDIKNIGVNFYF